MQFDLDKNIRYGLAYSGGVDSCYLLAELLREGYDVKAYTIAGEPPRPQGRAACPHRRRGLRALRRLPASCHRHPRGRRRPRLPRGRGRTHEPLISAAPHSRELRGHGALVGMERLCRHAARPRNRLSQRNPPAVWRDCAHGVKLSRTSSQTRPRSKLASGSDVRSTR